MKSISNHLGEIIVALACVALLISAVTFFNAPISNFFAGVVDKEVELGNTVMDGISDLDVSNISVNGDGAGGSGGSEEGTEGEDEEGPELFFALGSYMTGVTGTTVGNYTGVTETYENEEVPVESSDGDVYVYGDYEYRYNQVCIGDNFYSNELVEEAYYITLSDGWGARVLDPSKRSYGEILEEINGEPVVSAMGTFSGCTSLTEAPEIPDGVNNMFSTFSGCTSLTEAPEIPDGVTIMIETFSGCKALETAPVIPDGVTNMESAFKTCTSLTIAPVIPDSVIDMEKTFSSCTALETAPVIPASVTTMKETFRSCRALTGTIEINATNPKYDNCFAGTVETITLTGSCSRLAALAATSSSGNVTVAS